MSSFLTISDTNNTQIISDAETLEFLSGSGINITVNSTANEIDFDLDHNEINHDLLLNLFPTNILIMVMFLLLLVLG